MSENKTERSALENIMGNILVDVHLKMYQPFVVVLHWKMTELLSHCKIIIYLCAQVRNIMLCLSVQVIKSS